MAKTYRLTPLLRVGNVLMATFARLGIGPAHTYLLGVRGRKTGTLYTTPVTLVEDDGQRWLVSPYGNTQWFRNARAAGEVTLRRGGRSETVAIVEVGPSEAAPVLKRYITDVPITRPYFDVTPESSLEAFAAEAPRHPVFRIGSTPH